MENENMEDKIATACTTRESVLKENTNSLNEFYHACKKLPDLLNSCNLEWGSYGTTGHDEPVNSPLVQYLREIKKTFKNGEPDPKMLEMLAELARKTAENHAKRNDEHEGGGGFGWHPPRGYLEDPQIREQYPNYGFVDWHPAIRTAFYEGYYRTKKGTCNATFNLPSDPAMPFFVTPCADMICDMLDAAHGINHPDSPDKPEWRKRFSQMAWQQSETAIPKR
jgi:hypothetical protein